MAAGSCFSVAVGLLRVRAAAGGYHCLNTALRYHKDISVWLQEAKGDAFRMFIVLGKVGPSLSQEARGAITARLPFPTGPLFCTGLRGPCLSPSVVFSFLDSALPYHLPCPANSPFLLCPI